MNESKKNETLIILSLDSVIDKLNSFKTKEEQMQYMKDQLARPKEERWADYKKELDTLKKLLKRTS
jgi:hypothetical protein